MEVRQEDAAAWQLREALANMGACDVVQVAPGRVSPSLYSIGLLENLLQFAIVSMRPSCLLVVSLFAGCRASHSMLPPGALVLLWVCCVIGKCSLSSLFVGVKGTRAL